MAVPDGRHEVGGRIGDLARLLLGKAVLIGPEGGRRRHDQDHRRIKRHRS
jgi:hypothetical protein